MIELLEPKHISWDLINKLREINHDPYLTWAIRDYEHYIIDYSWIMSNLPPPNKNIRILDAGCGEGALQFWCHDLYDTYSADRIDYISRIYEKNSSIRFCHTSLNDTPFDSNFFDYIISCSALEHNIPTSIPYIMEELRRILRPGGKIIFTILARREPLYTDSDWFSFNGSTVRKFFVVSGLRLDSEFDNTSDFDNIYFNNFLPYFKTQPYPYIPLGVILRKI